MNGPCCTRKAWKGTFCSFHPAVRIDRPKPSTTGASHLAQRDREVVLFLGLPVGVLLLPRATLLDQLLLCVLVVGDGLGLVLVAVLTTTKSTGTRSPIAATPLTRRNNFALTSLTHLIQNISLISPNAEEA